MIGQNCETNGSEKCGRAGEIVRAFRCFAIAMYSIIECVLKLLVTLQLLCHLVLWSIIDSNLNQSSAEKQNALHDFCGKKYNVLTYIS